MSLTYEARLFLRDYKKDTVYNFNCGHCGGAFTTAYPQQKYHKECARKYAADKALARKKQLTVS
jgi:hypothetical protein